MRKNLNTSAKELTKIEKVFNGVPVEFRFDENGLSEVRINEVAKFCGFTTVATSGNECVRWNRINEHLKNMGCAEVHNGDFIPEYIMYRLIGKANNPKADAFMNWVGKTLVELRTKGVVILDNATEETIDFEKKFGKYRIRKTFSNTNDIIGDYKQFVELSKNEWKAKRINNDERIKLCNIICDALETRLANNMSNLKGSQMLMIRETITDIKDDIIALSNHKHGGIKTGQTKEIKRLKHSLLDIGFDALSKVG